MASNSYKVNIWPGYVAAMAGLLQSLVLVCGVIALTIMALSVNKTNSSVVSPAKLDLLDALSRLDLMKLNYPDSQWDLDPEAKKYLISFIEKANSSQFPQKITIWINVNEPTNSVKVRLAYLRMLTIKNLVNMHGRYPQNYEFRLFNIKDKNYTDELLHISSQRVSIK